MSTALPFARVEGGSDPSCSTLFKRHADLSLFADTLTLNARRLILSKMACVIGDDDATRAFFYAKWRRTLHVQIATEEPRPGVEARCKFLSRDMHGARDAGQHWQFEYPETWYSVGPRGRQVTRHVSLFRARRENCSSR